MRAEQLLPTRPDEQDRIEGTEQARRRDPLGRRAAVEVDETVLACGQLAGDLP